ncbi:MAG: type II secretion system F family protein [Planctomycetota bacterium]|jgi:type II secretory pathway component PulF
MRVATSKGSTSTARRGQEAVAPPGPAPSRGRGQANGQAAFRRDSGRISGIRQLQNVSMWARQLYVLVHSGTPLVQALAAIEKQTAAGPWKRILEDVRSRLDGGESFAEAISRHPRSFGPIARSLVAAGETSGQLDTMLDRLARLTRQQLRIRRSLIGAMVYPAMLITVSIAVVVAMIGFVLPRFAELFETMDAPLPPTTQVLMTAGEFGREHWLIVLVAIAGLSVLPAVLRSTQVGKTLLDAALVKAPYIGRIVRSFETAKITRLMGVLVESRVPLLDTLALTRSSTTNSLYRTLMSEAEGAVVEGKAMSAVFSKSRLVTPSLAEAIRHGEHSGQVGPIMVEMADFMDEENEITVRTLTSVIEPIILVLMGAMVAFIALSMFLPLFDLTAMTQGG